MTIICKGILEVKVKAKRALDGDDLMMDYLGRGSVINHNLFIL